MKYLDIGAMFGMQTADIFIPWNPTVINPRTMKEIEAEIEDCDLIGFGGGQDIHPSLYGHQNVATQAGQYPCTRDIVETLSWKLCEEYKKPILGICRGAQLACAMSGGSLIQDVRGHGATHLITTDDGQEMAMSSVHHQMMWPKDCNHLMVAWTKESISKQGDYDGTKIGRLKFPLDREPEVVYFPKTRALAVQGHPEFYADPMAPPVVYTRSLVTRFFGLTEKN